MAAIFEHSFSRKPMTHFSGTKSDQALEQRTRHVAHSIGWPKGERERDALNSKHWQRGRMFYNYPTTTHHTCACTCSPSMTIFNTPGGKPTHQLDLGVSQSTTTHHSDHDSTQKQPNQTVPYYHSSACVHVHFRLYFSAPRYRPTHCKQTFLSVFHNVSLVTPFAALPNVPVAYPSVASDCCIHRASNSRKAASGYWAVFE